MDEFELLADLHGGAERQGPGSRAATRRALELAGLAGSSGLRIADLGCGTGAAAVLLADALQARVDAVDLMPGFLRTLRENATAAGVGERITTHVMSIDALSFDHGSFDVIWSEGAIYNMGFGNGIRAWRPYLRDGGILAVSELTWLGECRPEAIEEHWQAVYPGVATAGEKIRQLEQAGYSLLGYFPLSGDCWMTNYYEPLQARFDTFLEKHGQSAEARALVEAERAEATLYTRYRDFYSYGFYVARRLPGDA